MEAALKLPNMIIPRLSDVTIVGKYSMPSRTTEQIVEALIPHLGALGYSVRYLPNVITIRNLLEPEEARKKKNYFSKLEAMRSGYPDEMTLAIHMTASGVLVIDATCFPIMRRKMGQSAQFRFPEAHVEDAQRLCKELMTKTMCILDATALVMPYVESSITSYRKTEFLSNTPSQNDLGSKAHAIIADARLRIYLVGWIDREFLGALENAKEKGVEVKIVTKSPDASDKTVKEDFGRLLKTLGRERVRVSSRFHDRFLVSDNKAIIGSMYFVSASKTRYESALITDEENVVNNLINHFMEIWNDVSSKPPQ